MLTALLSPLTILVSLSTATGVLVHDMHIDQAAAALAMPAMRANADLAKAHLNGADHTHVERVSASQTILHLNGNMPKVQPSMVEARKYLLQKRVARGHHAFDSYNLPLLG